MVEKSVSKPSNLFLHIGKSIKDYYGRQLGTITSFAVSPNGQVDAVFVLQGDGEFLRYPSERVQIDGENVVFLQSIKLRVKILCDEIPLVWRKAQALNQLLDKKKIPLDIFNELHKNFEGAQGQLRIEAQANLDSIQEQISNCSQQTRELNKALVHLEIEREIGRIDESSYQTALEIILDGFKKTNTEKADLESMQNQLSNLLLGDTQVPASVGENATSPQLPEPPVVVHVKKGVKIEP